MAFVPSRALEAALGKARVGVWIDLLQDGRIALVCKIPETVTKALHLGADCSFLLSVVQASCRLESFLSPGAATCTTGSRPPHEARSCRVTCVLPLPAHWATSHEPLAGSR